MMNSDCRRIGKRWICTVILAVLTVGLTGRIGLAQATSAGAFNIKLLNNNQPDFSDANAFGRSCAYGWATDQEKAISMWKWACLSRVQTDVSISEFFEKGIAPKFHGSDYMYQAEGDFITYMNSIPNQFCGYIAPALGAAWNRFTGYSYNTNNIAMHTTVDLWYGGQYHMFDPALNNYVVNDHGVVASALELQENFKKSGGAWWARANCPMRSCDNLNGPLLYDYRSLKELASKYDVVVPGRGGGAAINQMYLAMRPYTSYKRYKDPIAPSDENYFVPGRGDGDKTYLVDGNGSGRFPNSYWDNGICATNGQWIIEPDLTKPDWRECALSTDNVAQDKSPRLHPAVVGQDASIVFNITPYNSVAHMQISGSAVKGTADVLEILISYDAGKSWKFLEAIPGGGFSRICRQEVLARKCYLVKFRMKAASDAQSVGLDALKFKVVTQVNRLSFFALDRGNNKVYLNLGEQLERIECRPDFRPDRSIEFMHEQSNLTAGPGPYRTNVQLADTGKPGHAIYKIETPGDIQRVTMAGLFSAWDPNCPISLHYSTDLGRTWVKFTQGDIPLGDARIGEKGAIRPDDVGNEHYVQRVCSDPIKATGVKTALFKIDFAPTGPANAYPNGIWNVWMAADYAPAGFRPLEVTLSWKEFHRDGATPVRSFKKTVTQYTPWTVFDVNVAGYRPPLMQYVTVNCVGSNPDQVAEGYSDGAGDAGAADERTRYVYTMSDNLSMGKAVTCSVPPGGMNNDLATLSKLVDEMVGSFFRTGSRWWKGQSPEITITLDDVREIQGVSVYQNIDSNPAKGNTDSAYADSIEVSVSSDSVGWTRAGTISKYDVFDWPGDYLPFGFEAMQFASQFAGGITQYNFPLAFDKPLKGKYVRFKVSNPDAHWAACEIRVWGKMSKAKWDHDSFDHNKIARN